MLVEFKVNNYAGFKDEISFNLMNTRDYRFSSESIKDGIVKNAIVFGRNGSGKSNLSYAIMDITSNLSDFTKNNKKILHNLNNKSRETNFYYKFKLLDSYLEYTYTKELSSLTIMRETIKINGEEVLYYDKKENASRLNLGGSETLNQELDNLSISFVKYVKSNAKLDGSDNASVIREFFEFVDGMLLFSSLESNKYIGYTTRIEDIAEGIVRNSSGNLSEFENFLKSAGIDVKLSISDRFNGKGIDCNFEHGVNDIFNIASTGTSALILFYYWLSELRVNNDVTMLVMDEFDAFYHILLSRSVVNIVKSLNLQSIMTTHNTFLMNNSITRPDCVFKLENNKIVSFADSTNKELREAHNIEKIYRAECL